MAIDFQINKPTEVSEENLTNVVDAIYDTINNLAASADKFISKKSPALAPASESDKLKIVDDHSSGEKRISVKVGGMWYTTAALTKED